MAAPIYLGAGAFASDTRAFSVSWPTSGTYAVGDYGLLVFSSAAQLMDTPSGWTTIATHTTGGTPGDAGEVSVQIFGRTAASTTEAAVSIADVGSYGTAQIIVLGNCTAVGAVAKITQYDVTTFSTPGATYPAPGGACLVLSVIGLDCDAASTTTGTSYSSSTLANITERHDQTVSAGVGGGFIVVTGEPSPADSLSGGGIDVSLAVTTTVVAISLFVHSKFLPVPVGRISHTKYVGNLAYAPSLTGNVIKFMHETETSSVFTIAQSNCDQLAAASFSAVGVLFGNTYASTASVRQFTYSSETLADTGAAHSQYVYRSVGFNYNSTDMFALCGRNVSGTYLTTLRKYVISTNTASEATTGVTSTIQQGVAQTASNGYTLGGVSSGGVNSAVINRATFATEACVTLSVATNGTGAQSAVSNGVSAYSTYTAGTGYTKFSLTTETASAFAGVLGTGNQGTSSIGDQGYLFGGIDGAVRRLTYSTETVDVLAASGVSGNGLSSMTFVDSSPTYRPVLNIDVLDAGAYLDVAAGSSVGTGYAPSLLSSDITYDILVGCGQGILTGQLPIRDNTGDAKAAFPEAAAATFTGVAPHSQIVGRAVVIQLGNAPYIYAPVKGYFFGDYSYTGWPVNAYAAIDSSYALAFATETGAYLSVTLATVFSPLTRALSTLGGGYAAYLFGGFYSSGDTTYYGTQAAKVRYDVEVVTSLGAYTNHCADKQWASSGYTGYYLNGTVASSQRFDFATETSASFNTIADLSYEHIGNGTALYTKYTYGSNTWDARFDYATETLTSLTLTTAGIGDATATLAGYNITADVASKFVFDTETRVVLSTPGAAAGYGASVVSDSKRYAMNSDSPGSGATFIFSTETYGVFSAVDDVGPVVRGTECYQRRAWDVPGSAAVSVGPTPLSIDVTNYMDLAQPPSGVCAGYGYPPIAFVEFLHVAAPGVLSLTLNTYLPVDLSDMPEIVGIPITQIVLAGRAVIAANTPPLPVDVSVVGFVTAQPYAHIGTLTIAYLSSDPDNKPVYPNVTSGETEINALLSYTTADEQHSAVLTFDPLYYFYQYVPGAIWSTWRAPAGGITLPPFTIHAWAEVSQVNHTVPLAKVFRCHDEDAWYAWNMLTGENTSWGANIDRTDEFSTSPTEHLIRFPNPTYLYEGQRLGILLGATNSELAYGVSGETLTYYSGGATADHRSYIEFDSPVPYFEEDVRFAPAAGALQAQVGGKGFAWGSSTRLGGYYSYIISPYVYTERLVAVTPPYWASQAAVVSDQAAYLEQTHKFSFLTETASTISDLPGYYHRGGYSTKNYGFFHEYDNTFTAWRSTQLDYATETAAAARFGMYYGAYGAMGGEVVSPDEDTGYFASCDVFDNTRVEEFLLFAGAMYTMAATGTLWFDTGGGMTTGSKGILSPISSTYPTIIVDFATEAVSTTTSLHPGVSIAESRNNFSFLNEGFAAIAEAGATTPSNVSSLSVNYATLTSASNAASISLALAYGVTYNGFSVLNTDRSAAYVGHTRAFFSRYAPQPAIAAAPLVILAQALQVSSAIPYVVVTIGQMPCGDLALVGLEPIVMVPALCLPGPGALDIQGQATNGGISYFLDFPAGAVSYIGYAHRGQADAPVQLAVASVGVVPILPIALLRENFYWPVYDWDVLLLRRYAPTILRAERLAAAPPVGTVATGNATPTLSRDIPVLAGGGTAALSGHSPSMKIGVAIQVPYVSVGMAERAAGTVLTLHSETFVVPIGLTGLSPLPRIGQSTIGETAEVWYHMSSTQAYVQREDLGYCVGSPEASTRCALADAVVYAGHFTSDVIAAGPKVRITAGGRRGSIAVKTAMPVCRTH